jgi:MFS family permease
MTQPENPAPPATDGTGSSRGVLFAMVALCLGSLSGALMQSLVIPIQSELPALLGTAAGNASWAVTATLLGGAVTMPVTGRLADMYGKKRVLVGCAVILVLGSVLAALPTGLVLFIVGRTLQGVAMGYIPVAISLVGQIVPPCGRRRHRQRDHGCRRRDRTAAGGLDRTEL